MVTPLIRFIRVLEREDPVVVLVGEVPDLVPLMVPKLERTGETKFMSPVRVFIPKVLYETLKGSTYSESVNWCVYLCVLHIILPLGGAWRNRTSPNRL